MATDVPIAPLCQGRTCAIILHGLFSNKVVRPFLAFVLLLCYVS